MTTQNTNQTQPNNNQEVFQQNPVNGYLMTPHPVDSRNYTYINLVYQDPIMLGVMNKKAQVFNITLGTVHENMSFENVNPDPLVLRTKSSGKSNDLHISASSTSIHNLLVYCFPDFPDSEEGSVFGWPFWFNTEDKDFENSNLTNVVAILLHERPSTSGASNLGVKKSLAVSKKTGTMIYNNWLFLYNKAIPRDNMSIIVKELAVSY